MKILALIPIILSVTSCFSQKKQLNKSTKTENSTFTSENSSSNNPISPSTISKSGLVEIGHLNWKEFSGRYDVDVEMGEGQSYNGVMSFRMKRDSIFWFSVSASIGFQIAKGIIQNDTIQILDLLNRHYYSLPLDLLQENTQLPASISALQRLFTGEVLSDAVYYNEADSSFRGDKSFYSGYQVKFYPSNYVARNAINDEVNARNLWAEYGERISQENPGHNVSMETKIYLKNALNTIRLNVRLKTYSFEPIPSYPFNVPSSYTPINIW